MFVITSYKDENAFYFIYAFINLFLNVLPLQITWNCPLATFVSIIYNPQ